MTDAMQSETVSPVDGPGRRRAGRSLRWIWAPVLLVTLVVAGLVYYANRPRGPWAPVLAKAAEAAQSPFGHRVFQDGSLSPDEYTQANNKIVECARGRGVTLNLENRYGLVIFSSSGSYEIDTLNACETGDPATIRSLYEQVYKDPRREGSVIYSRCLTRQGFPAAMTSPPPGGTIDDVFDRLLDASSPTDYPRVERCIYDPAGHSAT
jgi:hypothetical protein